MRALDIHWASDALALYGLDSLLPVIYLHLSIEALHCKRAPLALKPGAKLRFAIAASACDAMKEDKNASARRLAPLKIRNWHSP
jgi:hypothetical protein